MACSSGELEGEKEYEGKTEASTTRTKELQERNKATSKGLGEGSKFSRRAGVLKTKGTPGGAASVCFAPP